MQRDQAGGAAAEATATAVVARVPADNSEDTTGLGTAAPQSPTHGATPAAVAPIGDTDEWVSVGATDLPGDATAGSAAVATGAAAVGSGQAMPDLPTPLAAVLAPDVAAADTVHEKLRAEVGRGDAGSGSGVGAAQGRARGRVRDSDDSDWSRASSEGSRRDSGPDTDNDGAFSDHESGNSGDDSAVKDDGDDNDYDNDGADSRSDVGWLQYAVNTASVLASAAMMIPPPSPPPEPSPVTSTRAARKDEPKRKKKKEAKSHGLFSGLFRWGKSTKTPADDVPPMVGLLFPWIAKLVTEIKAAERQVEQCCKAAAGGRSSKPSTVAEAVAQDQSTFHTVTRRCIGGGNLFEQLGEVDVLFQQLMGST